MTPKIHLNIVTSALLMFAIFLPQDIQQTKYYCLLSADTCLTSILNAASDLAHEVNPLISDIFTSILSSL